jgi:hypothetical protein
MAISKRLRYEVLRRDNHTCRYCGGAAPEVKLTVDHVLPTALGGKDAAENLVAACADCNAGKSSSHPDQALVDQVASDALAWAEAMRRAAEIRALEQLRQDDYVHAFWEKWAVEWAMKSPDNAEQSVINLYRAGLPLAEMELSVDIAGNATGVYPSNRFRYFCGVAWKKISAMHEIAAAIYEANREASS